MPERTKNPILSPHEEAAVLKMLIDEDDNPSIAKRLLLLHDRYEHDQSSSNPDDANDQ